MTTQLKAGDTVQFFGTTRLPEGGFPWIGEATVVGVDDEGTAFFSGELPKGLVSGDYLVKK